MDAGTITIVLFIKMILRKLLYGVGFLTSYEILGFHAAPLLTRKNFQITAGVGPTYV